MSPIVDAVLRTTVLPAIGAGILLLVTGGLREPWRDRLQALVVAAGFSSGAYLLLGRLDLPPADVSEALTYIAGLLALFVGVSPKDMGARYGLRALFVLLVGGLLLWPIRESLTGQVHLRNMAAFFFLGLGVWSIVERSARQVSPLSLMLLPLIAGTGTSVVLALSGSLSLAQLLGVLCGQVGAAAALALLRPRRLSPVALLPFVSVFIVAFMTAGHFYLDANPWRMVILCWPFLILWIRNWIPAPKRQMTEAAILGLLAAAPVGYFLWTLAREG